MESIVHNVWIVGACIEGLKDLQRSLKEQWSIVEALTVKAKVAKVVEGVFPLQ